ncbi:MAG: malonyl-ACP O-methyltransferase BioC [Gammaproteobacteria bacterium]
MDKAKVRSSFAAAAQNYDGMAALQRRVGIQLLQRFPCDRCLGTVLDVGCGTGFLTNQLALNASGRRLIAMDLALPMMQASRDKYPNLAAHYICADAEDLPFLPATVERIYSNLALQWAQDLPATLVGFKRVLKTDGQLVFATFGPKTLFELKKAWAGVDDYPHVNDFHAADGIRKFLRHADFNSVSMDSEIYRSSYPSVHALMRELKGIGAHNVNRGRNPKPTTKAQLQKMIDSYHDQMQAADIVASYEIIFVKAQA